MLLLVKRGRSQNSEDRSWNKKDMVCSHLKIWWSASWWHVCCVTLEVSCLSQVLKIAAFVFLNCVRSGLSCHLISSSGRDVSSLLMLPHVHLVWEDLSPQTNKQVRVFRIIRCILLNFMCGWKKVVTAAAELQIADKINIRLCKTVGQGFQTSSLGVPQDVSSCT